MIPSGGISGKMLVFIAALALCGIASGNPVAESTVVCDEAKFDEAAGKLLLYANNDKQPETLEDLTESCLVVNKTFEWIENYTKDCIKGIAGGVMRLLLDSSGEELHSRCYGDRQSEYLKHTPCMNTVAKELSNCDRDMTALLEATAKQEQRKLLLAHSCCSIQVYAHCMETRVRAKCNQEAGEFAKSIVYGIGENLLEGACGKFTLDADECKSLPKTNPDAMKYRSFVPAMINVLKLYG